MRRMRTMIACVLVGLGLAVGLTACGGSDAPSPAPTTAGSPAEQGRALFTSAGCGSCHTLAAAGTTGQVGPNLDAARPDAAKVRRQVTRGGSGMPSFADSLTPAQIRLLAEYVSGQAGTR